MSIRKNFQAKDCSNSFACNRPKIPLKISLQTNPTNCITCGAVKVSKKIISLHPLAPPKYLLSPRQIWINIRTLQTGNSSNVSGNKVNRDAVNRCASVFPPGGERDETLRGETFRINFGPAGGGPGTRDAVRGRLTAWRTIERVERKSYRRSGRRCGVILT